MARKAVRRKTSRKPGNRSVAALENAVDIYRKELRDQNERWLEVRHDLQRAHDHATSLYNNAPVGLLTMDAHGIIVDVNEVAAKMTGQQFRRIVGKPLLVFVTMADRHILLEHLRRSRAGETTVTSELTLQRNAGTPLPVQLVSRAVVQGQQVLYHTIIVDLSSRRQSEQALRVSEKRYREIVETANEGICIVNIHNRITFLNRRFAEMIGASVDDLLGESMYDLMPPEDIPEAQATFAKRRPPADAAETRLRRRDGRIVWVSVSTSRMQDDTGRFSGMLLMYTDITERKEQDAHRERLVTQLVTAQEAERRRIARELHDQLGQHIVALSLGLQRLGAVRELTTEARTVLTKLKELSEAMARDVHHVALELRPTALDDIGLPDALTHYAAEVSRRYGIAVDVHCDPQVRLSSTGETVIYRIAQEALINVVKHANAKRASVILERRAASVQLIVEDDGAGFQADRILRFSPLEQRLGLTGMIERASLIGGELHIESTPGRGTTLFLRIVPKAQEAPDEKATSAPRR